MASFSFELSFWSIIMVKIKMFTDNGLVFCVNGDHYGAAKSKGLGNNYLANRITMISI